MGIPLLMACVNIINDKSISRFERPVMNLTPIFAGTEVKKKFFISQYLQNEYPHGGVGLSDAEKILLSKGFEPITFPHHSNFSLAAKIGRVSFLVRTLLKVKKSAVVAFIYPFYAFMDELLVHLLLSKGIKVICFIVDVDGIRDGNMRLFKKEISLFKRMRYFIVLNDEMEAWLRKEIPHVHYASKIYFHSFLVPPVQIVRRKSFEIVFAGNLGKSPFLEQLHMLSADSPHLRFHLYGPSENPSLKNQANVTYHGVERPHELPSKLKGSFGLIWEGDCIKEPVGHIAHYIQIVSHHKLSLYILSKLPVIVAATAASATLVRKYNIGFSIESLYEMEKKISRLSETEYAQMQTNMQPLAERISKGEFLSNALDELTNVI